MYNIKLATALFVILALVSFKNNVSFHSSVIGNTVNDFRLKNIDNNFVSLNNIKGAKGFMVIFTCNHCPFAKLYTKRLNELDKKYKSLGVPLIAINSMDSLLYKEETFVFMQQMAKNEKYGFYYLQDAQQVVGKDFGAKHTPQAYVIWKENEKWVIKYSGAIDDDGENPSKAQPFIANAVNELLSGKKVSNPETESFGCRIFYRK